MNGQFDRKTFGVEAAHVRRHSHEGPSTIENGKRNEHTYPLFHQFDNTIILHPVDDNPTVSLEYVRWHRVNCFRG